LRRDTEERKETEVAGAEEEKIRKMEEEIKIESRRL
jgi:hypothetical protein